MKYGLTLILALLMGSISLFAQDEKLMVSGSQQITEDNKVRLKCNGIHLKHEAEIEHVEGDNFAGFWITGRRDTVREWKNISYAEGFALSPGLYWVYPHLRQNSKKATVKVYFRKD